MNFFFLRCDYGADHSRVLPRQAASPPRPTALGGEPLFMSHAHHLFARDELYSGSAATRNVRHFEGLGPAHFAYARGLTLAILPCR